MRKAMRSYHLVCVGTAGSRDQVVRMDVTAEYVQDIPVKYFPQVVYADYVLAIDIRCGETYLLKNRDGRDGIVMPNEG